MSEFIYYIGYVVIASGGIALMALIAGMAMNYGWRKFNDFLTYNELCKAVQEYRKNHADTCLKDIEQ